MLQSFRWGRDGSCRKGWMAAGMMDGGVWHCRTSGVAFRASRIVYLLMLLCSNLLCSNIKRVERCFNSKM